MIVQQRVQRPAAWGSTDLVQVSHFFPFTKHPCNGPDERHKSVWLKNRDYTFSYQHINNRSLILEDSLSMKNCKKR